MDVNITVPITPLSPESVATLLALEDASVPGGDTRAHYSAGGWIVHCGAVTSEERMMTGNMLPQSARAARRMRPVVREVFLVRVGDAQDRRFVVSCARLEDPQALRVWVVALGATFGAILQVLFAAVTYLLAQRLLPAYAVFAAAIVGAMLGFLLTFAVGAIWRIIPQTPGLDALVDEVRAKATPFLLPDGS